MIRVLKKHTGFLQDLQIPKDIKTWKSKRAFKAKQHL